MGEPHGEEPRRGHLGNVTMGETLVNLAENSLVICFGSTIMSRMSQKKNLIEVSFVGLPRFLWSVYQGFPRVTKMYQGYQGWPW